MFVRPQLPLSMARTSVLVQLLVVFSTINPDLERRNHGLEPQIRSKLTGLIASYARSINKGNFPCRPPKRRNSLRPSGALWACAGDKGNVAAVRASAATGPIQVPYPPRDCRWPADRLLFARQPHRDEPSQRHCPSTSPPAWSE